MRFLSHLPPLLLFCLLAGPGLLSAQEPDLREIFTRAYSSYGQGDLHQARELFLKTRDPGFLLADYSLHYLALIAYQEKDWESARQFLAQLRERYPQSLWFQPAELLRAKLDLAQYNYSQAIAAFSALRAVKGLSQEIAEEALYLQAQAYEGLGDAEQAYSLYRELRAAWPGSRWTSPARSAQLRIRGAHRELFGFMTLQSLSDEADQLMRERDYQDAEVLYKKLLNNAADPELKLSLMARLAALYLATRKRDEAIPVLEQIAGDFPETREAPKSLYQIGRILWNRNENSRALEYFTRIMERYPTSPYAERARYAAGDIYEASGNKDEAIYLYSSLSTQFPNSPVRDDAAWRLAWLYYRAGDYPKAAAGFKDLAGHSTGTAIRVAALYWQARTMEKLGDEQTAAQLHRQIVKSGDESYYRGLAQRCLDRLGASITEPKSSPPSVFAGSDPALSAETSFHLARARELNAISLNRLAVNELDEAKRLGKNGNPLRPILMREYFRNGAYDRSLVLANQLPASYEARNIFRFPLAYWGTIQEKARQRGIDPYLVLAVIRQESLFDTRARSPAFALGLMQLLPSTAARVARQIGISPPSAEKLYDPELNLTLGTQYLKDLLDRYSNNWFKAVAAYNAGEAAVDRWQKEIATDDIEEFVERIPYVETRGYVKLVMRNHRIYKRLYETTQ